jgi:hypothetical protein
MSAARSLRAVATLAPLLVLGACRITRVEEPAGMQLNQPAQLDPARAWRVVAEGQTLGVVVQFEMNDDPNSSAHHYYSVRNRLEQELGSIDALGRAWRFELHQRDARLVTTGTVLQGACAILGLAGSAQLVEEPLDALRGVTDRR